MRTNIVLDDELLKEAFRYYRTKSKTALVKEALRTYVRVKAEERRRENYKERLRELQQRLSHVRTRQTAADIIREDREGR